MQQNFQSKANWVKKGKKLGTKKFFGQKGICVQRSVVQINVGPKKIKAPKNFVPNFTLVKIGSLTAEIMLIWTNVARTYVA